MSTTIASAASPSQPLSMPKTTALDAASKVSLDSCSPKALAEALIAVRGKEESLRILQEATKIASQQETKVVSPDEKQRSSGDSNNKEELLGKPLLSEPIETSFLSPRMGKFSLQIHENGLLATKTNDPTVQLTLLKKTASTNSDDCAFASHVLLFPKPEDCKAIVYNRKLDEDSKPKKVGGSLVVLYLESPVQLPKQKSPTQQLCFALPCDKKLGVPTAPSLVNGEKLSLSDPTQAWGNLLQGSLGGKLAQVLGDKRDFQSYQAPNTSTTTAGMPFVSCYLGVNDGVLYPLEEGLLFYKPPKFLPRSNLHSIACGRGGGGGDSSSRYVDMVVQCSGKDDETEAVEFTNIQREENTVLNSYIHDVLVPAMTRDASKKGDESNDDSDQVVVEAIAEDETEDESTEDQEVDEDDTDDDSDDEDFRDYAPNDGSDSEEADSSDDDDDYGEDDEGVAVVDDDFAQELVKEKRRKRKECSDTESEDEDSSGKPRFSKRLRKD